MPPRWNHWKHISNPETWQVLALSLNREPDGMLREYGEIALLYSSGRTENEKPEYARYLDRAHQVLDAAGWASVNNVHPGKRWLAMKMPANVGTVAALARYWGWETPQEFRDLATAVPSLSRAEIVERHRHHWPSIERDLQDASGSGLARARLDPNGRGWLEQAALSWAAANGKLNDEGAIDDEPDDLSIDAAMRKMPRT